MTNTFRVRVNVGGQVFETYSDTLQRIPYFAALLSGKWNTPQEIFVDQDPEDFRAILQWARNNQRIPSHIDLGFWGLHEDEDVKLTFECGKCGERSHGKLFKILPELQRYQMLETCPLHTPVSGFRWGDYVCQECGRDCTAERWPSSGGPAPFDKFQLCFHKLVVAK